MRRAISIVAVAAISVTLLVLVAPSNTGADMDATKNQNSIHGLHVALPDGMKNFPMDLVPLP